MLTYPAGLECQKLVKSFIFVHTLLIREARALGKQRNCVGSPDPSLLEIKSLATRWHTVSINLLLTQRTTYSLFVTFNTWINLRYLAVLSTSLQYETKYLVLAYLSNTVCSLVFYAIISQVSWASSNIQQFIGANCSFGSSKSLSQATNKI